MKRMTSPGGREHHHTLTGENRIVNSPNRNQDSLIMQNQARGRAFECDALCALGVNKNTQRIQTTLPNGSPVTVIPDAIRGRTLIEIKDAQYITMSNQLRGYFEKKQPVELIVSPRTQDISKQVHDRIMRSEGSIRIYDPATGKFTTWKPK